jgi:hypothetical protein
MGITGTFLLLWARTFIGECNGNAHHARGWDESNIGPIGQEWRQQGYHVRTWGGLLMRVLDVRITQGSKGVQDVKAPCQFYHILYNSP